MNLSKKHKQIFSSPKIVAALILMSGVLALFALNVLAVSPRIKISIQDGTAALLADSGYSSESALVKFELEALPQGCTVTWKENASEDADKHSCEIIRGKERFSIIQFPMNHVTQILGNNAGSPLTQNDIEGINEQFYLVDSIDDLDVSVLESHTVICWSSDTCYYVVLNSTWTNFDDMKNILQGIRP